MGFRPHPRSSSVGEILQHQLLSERRFFAEFLGVPEPAPAYVLPRDHTPDEFARRVRALALRVAAFWRRVLHTAHHRTELTVYLRLMGKLVPPTYGPTADVTWEGADPTHTPDAAGRFSSSEA